MRGLSIRDNAMGFTAVRLHYTADETKDPENADPELAASARRWLETQRQQWPDPNDFEREFEVNFFVSKGTRVFPQFRQEQHAKPLVVNPRKVIYRGWDFGWHCPVCLFAQIDAQGRLLVLREIVGRQTDTHDFASRVLKDSESWYPRHAAGYEDYCDPAGQQVQSITNEKNERRDTEVLVGLGIYPKYQFGWSRKDGRTLVHRLLAVRGDGTTGLVVDPDQAPTVLQAFLGRYVYPETRLGTIRDEPDDETHPWADVMAAIRYLVIGLQGRLGIARFAVATAPTPTAPPSFHGYGTPRKAGA